VSAYGGGEVVLVPWPDRSRHPLSAHIAEWRARQEADGGAPAQPLVLCPELHGPLEAMPDARLAMTPHSISK